MHPLVAFLAATKQSSPLPTLILFIVVPVAMYFLLIRPQRRRQRESVALQSSIEIGDEVITVSGMYGFVTGFDGDIAWLEIDDNVQIRVSRAAIQRRVDTSSAGTAHAGDKDDDEDTSVGDASPKGRSTKITDVDPDDESK